MLLLAPPPSRAKEPDPSIGRIKASQLLGILKTNKEPDKREQALSLLGRLGPQTQPIISGVFRALKEDSDRRVRARAAQVLGSWDPKKARGSIEALADRLKKDKENRVREAAATALGKLVPQSKKVLSVLVKALKDPHGGTRAAAARTIGALGRDADAALPDLLAALKNPKLDRFTRIYCAQAALRLDTAGGRVIPALKDILGDKKAHQELRKKAAELVGTYGPLAKDAVPELGQAMATRKNTVELRREAAVALGKIGPEAKGAWEEIRTAMFKDSDTTVRYQAIRVAGAVARDEPKAVTALGQAALKEKNVEARLAAIQELGKLGSAAKGALPKLARIKKESSRAVIRQAAADAINKIKKASADS
jgi:HEAT repeat protein